MTFPSRVSVRGARRTPSAAARPSGQTTSSMFACVVTAILLDSIRQPLPIDRTAPSLASLRAAPAFFGPSRDQCEVSAHLGFRQLDVACLDKLGQMELVVL